MSIHFSFGKKSSERPKSQAPQLPPTQVPTSTDTPPTSPPHGRPSSTYFTAARPSSWTVVVSPPRDDADDRLILLTPRSRKDHAPHSGSFRDALLGGDAPLVVREETIGQPPRFRFNQRIDPAKHRAPIADACAEWFGSSARQDRLEGLAFLDAVIDQTDTPALSHHLLEKHGADLLQLAPPPWEDTHLPAIASCLQALSHQLTLHTPSTLRQLVLAFHPEAEVATELQELKATVQALEQAGAPLSQNDALKLVQRLNRLSEEALKLGSLVLVRTAVDLAQRVANGSAPAGQTNPPAVQALVNVMVKALPSTLNGVVTLRINDWLFLNIAWRPGPEGRQLLDCRIKQALIDEAPEAARQALLQWVQEQQAKGAGALPWADLQPLVDELMPCFGRPLSTEERLKICHDEALLRLNPQPLLNLLATLLDGAPADAELLRELLERYCRPDVPVERRTAFLRGARPLLPHPFDDPRLHLAYRQLIDTLPDGDEKPALLKQHEAAVRPARASPNSPSGYVSQHLRDRARYLAPSEPSGPSVHDNAVLLPDDPTAWFGPTRSASEAEADQAQDRLFVGEAAPLRHDLHGGGFTLAVHQSDELLPHLPAVGVLCAAWLRSGQAPQAIALLGLVLSAIDDPGACRTLLAALAAALNSSPASAWANGQGDGVLDAIRALAASGWFLADKPHCVKPAARLALLQLLGRVDPVAAISLAASELGHRVAQDPAQPLALAEGQHLAELLGLLLRLGSEQNDPAVLKQALEGAKALSAACGPRPTSGAAAVQARFNLLIREGHKALTQWHIDRLSDWLTLRWEAGSGGRPNTLSLVRVRCEGDALKRPKDPVLAWSALIGLIDGQLADPQGFAWAKLVELAVTASAALEQAVAPAQWWAWCVMEAQRTGRSHALQHQLERRQSIDSPDSPLFDDVLSVCGDPRLSEADRAALLCTACQQLQLAATLNDQRDDDIRACVMDWLQVLPEQPDGLGLSAIQALAQALPWPLEAHEWLALCLSDARHRGQAQGLIDWLNAPPPDAHRFIDKELFLDILALAQNAPLSGGDRQRLLLAAQALLNGHLLDAPLQARYDDALRSLRSPRKGSGGYPKAYQTLFQNSPRLFSPPGDEQPEAFQLNQPALSPGEVEALITVCDTWAQNMQMQKVQKLLNAVLGGTQDLSLHRQLLTRYADRLATLLPGTTQQAQWQGILSAIAGLARQGWATAGHANETDATVRTVLSTLVRTIDWGQYAQIQLGAIEHQIQHLPTATLQGGTGRALQEQLARLSLASIGKDDAGVAQHALRLARALALQLGDGHALQAPLKDLFNEVSQRWFDPAQRALSTWFVLQRSTAPSSSPKAGQTLLQYGWCGQDKTAATREQQALAWRALLQWVRIELENPHGLAWVDLQTLLGTVEDAWQPLDRRQWLALCLLEVSRSGSLSSLDQRLAIQRGKPLDEAMLRKLLALASDTRFPAPGRAALWGHLVHSLPPYKTHEALHEDFLRTLFRRFEPGMCKALLKTYRGIRAAQADEGLTALIRLVTHLEKESLRSSKEAWEMLEAAPQPDAKGDWAHWRRLCGQLARSMTDRIQLFQTAPFVAVDKQKFNYLVVQVLLRLSSSDGRLTSTVIDRQFELLSDLVEALPTGHRATFLHQIDATCAQHIGKALSPRGTALAPTLPLKLLALQGAVRALATRHGGQAPTPPATDRPLNVERAVQDFSDVFRARLASQTGPGRPDNSALKALRTTHERRDIVSPHSSEVAGMLIELLARYITD